jgi:hypothetical protein
MEVNMTKTLSLSALLLGAAVLAGCASPPYARLEGARYFHTNLDTYPVIVSAVDGASTSANIPVLVEPGRHAVRVQALPNGVQRFGEIRTVSLDLAPCTRYWLVAVKSSPLATDFDVKVDYSEPIAGCAAPKS